MSGTLSQTAWDTLFPVRNAFYLGNLPECQREARTLIDKKNTSLQSMPEVYFFRSLIQQGSFEQVYKGITSSSPVGLQVVKLLAQFKQAQAAGNDNKETVFASLLEFLEDAATAQDGTVRLIAAQIYLEGGDFKEALKLVHDGDTIEMMSLCVCIYLAMHRNDLAERQIKAMQSVDEDDTLTQLSVAWVNLAVGGDRTQEAYLILQELVEKFGPSVQVATSLGVCQLHLKKYEEAAELFKEARELAQQTKQKVGVDTIVNSIVCMQLLRRTDLVPQLVDELKAAAPNHPWLQKQAEMGAYFDKCTETYA